MLNQVIDGTLAGFSCSVDYGCHTAEFAARCFDKMASPLCEFLGFPTDEMLQVTVTPHVRTITFLCTAPAIYPTCIALGALGGIITGLTETTIESADDSGD